MSQNVKQKFLKVLEILLPDIFAQNVKIQTLVTKNELI